MTDNAKTPLVPVTETALREGLASAPEAPRAENVENGEQNDQLAGDGAADGANRDGRAGIVGARAAGGGKGRQGGRRHGEIWDDCPVTPLGVYGDYVYVLDVLGQLRKAKKLEAQVIQSLFGRHIPKLCFRFAMWKKGEGDVLVRIPHRFDQTTASMTIYAAASECGVFNPDNSVRGVGAWTDDDGNLVYHLGDKVLIGGTKRAPGRHDGRIYPAFPPVPHPDPNPKAIDPVPEILATLETWNWAVPDVHPFLMLGVISTQMLCGALDWRPVFWLLAAAGSGKSELQKLVKLLHGENGLVQSTDPTKSGITSKLGQSSLPVSIDELEPGDERSHKERDLVALARVAASGGEWMRGTADQTGVGGKVFSAFLFSSVLIPGIMKTQDVQRLIRLELLPFEGSPPPLNLVPRTWRARGARLKALLIDRWPTWADRLSLWRHALELQGVTGRDADNWGTVLAMADMAQNDQLPDASLTGAWVDKIGWLVEAGRDETMNDAEAMLLHLMGQPFDIYRRGELHTIAQWVMVAANLPGAPRELLSDDLTHLPEERRSKANTKLAKVGLRVSGRDADAKLFIANKSIPGLKDLFRGTDWAGGVWQQSAKRVPGAEPVPSPLTLAGIRSRGYYLPVKSIPGLVTFPMDRDVPARAPVGGDEIEDFT